MQGLSKAELPDWLPVRASHHGQERPELHLQAEDTSASFLPRSLQPLHRKEVSNLSRLIGGVQIRMLGGSPQRDTP